MILKRISILNYKNLGQVELDFSPKMNCFIGQNGMGKTNLLDAVYYLSFCKSAANPIDSQNMMHDQEFFVIQGFYETEAGDMEEVYCGMKRRQKKQFKRNKKEYQRLSDHIGFIPLVMVSPADSELIAGGSEERRRFMDVVISQYDKEYLEALIRYNKALQQRNTLLKAEVEPDEELMLVWEEMMAATGEVVYRKRRAFIDEFIPTFQTFYSHISQDRETVNLAYESVLVIVRSENGICNCLCKRSLVPECFTLLERPSVPFLEISVCRLGEHTGGIQRIDPDIFFLKSFHDGAVMPHSILFPGFESLCKVEVINIPQQSMVVFHLFDCQSFV